MSELIKFTKENEKLILGICLAVILILFASLFGSVGIKTFFIFLILFLLPYYILFDMFDIDTGEKILFSFVISLAAVPSIIFYINKTIESLKTSAIIGFVITLLIVLLIRFVFRKIINKKTSVHKTTD